MGSPCKDKIRVYPCSSVALSHIAAGEVADTAWRNQTPFRPKAVPRSRKKRWKLGRAVCYNHHRCVPMYSMWLRTAFVALSGVC